MRGGGRFIKVRVEIWRDWTISFSLGRRDGEPSLPELERALDMETYFDNMTVQDGSAEKLMRDCRVLMHDAEELIRDGCRVLGEQTRIAAEEADEAVRRYPAATAGVAFGFGVMIGLLLGRR
jgi:ElaB/YqjD/DUF883 family membrane-anchored ribosome-binding protein